MRFGPPEAFRSELHPPPSFWSTSAANQAPTAFLDDASPHAHQIITGVSPTFEGTAGASTLCSALRRRQKLIAASPGKAVCDDGIVGGRPRSGRGASRRRRRPGRGAMGCSPRPRPPQSPFGDGRDVSASAAVSCCLGRFSPKTAAVPPPKPRECWGGDRSSRPYDSSQPQPPPPPPSAPSPGEQRGGGEQASDDSPTRTLRWGPAGSETEEQDSPEEKDEQARAPMSPGRKEGGQARRSGLIDGISPRLGSTSPAVSTRRGTIGGGRGGPAVTGFAFLEIQRDLLRQLESLFVSTADDRRHALVGLKREENEWKASAIERARSDVRAAAAAAATTTDGATGAACSSGRGGGLEEERMRESIVEGGPGAAARKVVGLVRVGGVDDEDGSDVGIEGDSRLLRSTGSGGGRGRREDWRLPKAVVEEMRKEFAAKMDQETAEVLEQENKALLEERAGMAAREGARTRRELRELSDRLTNDGRDALAGLQMELEAEEEARLAQERGKLREALACSLQRERERLITERQLAVFDMRDASGRESSQLAASLWEQAERSTSARRAEAVRLLDRAAERARAQLDALLQAQGQRGLEDVWQGGSVKRKAAIRRAREEGEKRCLEELKVLADGASKKHDAWLRMILRDLRQALVEGGSAEGAGARAGGVEGEGEGEGEGENGDDTIVAPALQLRAVEASEDCARLGRRLVELVIKEALVRLRDSGFDVVTSRDDERIGPGVQNSIGSRRLGDPGQDQALAPRITEDCRVSEKCRDCERLARANVELSRLLLQTTAPATSPAAPPPPAVGAREEGRFAASTLNNGARAAAAAAAAAIASNAKHQRSRGRKAATAAAPARAAAKRADGGGIGCGGDDDGGSKITARVKTRSPVVRLIATAGRHSRK